MPIKSWHYGLAAAVAIALELLSIAGLSVPWAQGQPDCTVTVQPGQPIQQAIDEAKEGAVICLAAGTWGENIEIRKSVTLRGAGRKQTKIKGNEEYEPIIKVKSDSEIEVRIEGLTAAEAQIASGIEIADKARVTFTNTQVSGNERNGIVMEDSAQATIENNIIQENRECGLRSSSDKPAQGQGNRLVGNGADLCGNLSAHLRIPLVPETSQTELSFPGPYPTLQETIDALAPGGTITLAAGEHQGSVTIWKPLTLKGVGQEEVKIRKAVSLISEAQGAQIEGVTITSSVFTGLLLGGQVKVTLTNSQVSDNKYDGIWIGDSAQITIANSLISNNVLHGIKINGQAQLSIIANSQILKNALAGIWMEDSSRATITSSHISDNLTGIWIDDSAQATITNSKILGNSDGITTMNSAQVAVVNSLIASNGDGIEIGGSTKATITNSRVLSNRKTGILMKGLAQAEIRGSIIEGNGTSELCKGGKLLCSGVSVWGESRGKIIGSRIIKNADWGVEAYLKQCGYEKDNFTGQVLFEEMMLEDISGNNTTGNQNGMGNPGNHYWNRPDIPDGQVCLP
jgi:parallel beta-helix repeat protein